MVRILNILFILSFALPMCASENKDQQIIITARVQTNPQLVYLSSEKIAQIKNFIPLVEINEPFFPMEKYETEDQRARFTEQMDTLNGLKKDSLSNQENIDSAIRKLQSNIEVIEVSKIFNDFNTHAR